jgi:hypothetical protein
MRIRQIKHKLLIICFIFLPGLGCEWVQSGTNFDAGIYKRYYTWDRNTYEIVDLQSDGTYVQKFYEKGRLRFSNTGKWVYIHRNKDHTPKWPNGRSIILFSDWLRGDELLHRERIGASSEIGVLTKQTVAAVVYEQNGFAFDYDGGSDYIKQSN